MLSRCTIVFTIAELLIYEAMGLAEKGKGGNVIADGISAKGGKLPVNPSGGLKSKGHPIGATGVSMHVMAAMQARGDAGDLQIEGARDRRRLQHGRLGRCQLCVYFGGCALTRQTRMALSKI